MDIIIEVLGIVVADEAKEGYAYIGDAVRRRRRSIISTRINKRDEAFPCST